MPSVLDEDHNRSVSAVRIRSLCREMIKGRREPSRPATAPWTILACTGPVIRIVSTAQVHTNPTDPLIKRRNSSETMTYFTLVALMMLVLSPVLIPLVITGAHTIGNLLTA
jgi:hypothetical protein